MSDPREKLYHSAIWELMQWAERADPLDGGCRTFSFGMESGPGGPIWSARLREGEPGRTRANRDIEIRSPGNPDAVVRAAKLLAEDWHKPDEEDGE